MGTHSPFTYTFCQFLNVCLVCSAHCSCIPVASVGCQFPSDARCWAAGCRTRSCVCICVCICIWCVCDCAFASVCACVCARVRMACSRIVKLLQHIFAGCAPGFGSVRNVVSSEAKGHHQRDPLHPPMLPHVVLQETMYRGLNSDQWRNFISFSFCIRIDFSNYDANDACMTCFVFLLLLPVPLAAQALDGLFCRALHDTLAFQSGTYG